MLSSMLVLSACIGAHSDTSLRKARAEAAFVGIIIAVALHSTSTPASTAALASLSTPILDFVP
jgi:hypothetical protein